MEKTGAAGEEEGVAFTDRPTGEEAAALRRAFDQFVARLTPPTQATIRDHVAWVEGIIGDDPALAHPSAPRDTGSLHVVAQARRPRRNPAAATCPARRRRAANFQGRAARPGAGRISAERTPHPHTLRPFLRRAARRHRVDLLHPPAPREDVILVAPVFHARGLSFRAVALLGLSEGEFPSAEREDPLLREDDRALLRKRGLNLEPRLRGEEATLFYEAVTRARERLLLCRPYLADDGQTVGAVSLLG